MFNFNFATDSLKTDWGERLLNTVVRESLRHLFTQSQVLEVCVRCYPSTKLLLGSIDGFRMRGCGLMIGKDFPIEEMSLETDTVAIDFQSVLKGSIQLKQPTAAVAVVVLSEAGINRAFKSELVKQHLKYLASSTLSNLWADVEFCNVSVQLLAENQVRFLAEADLPNYGKVPIRMTASLAVEQQRLIRFQYPRFELEQVPEFIRAIAHDLTASFIQLLNHLVDLERFELNGIKLRLNSIETQGQKLLLNCSAQISHFPGTANSNIARPQCYDQTPSIH